MVFKLCPIRNIYYCLLLFVALSTMLPEPCHGATESARKEKSDVGKRAAKTVSFLDEVFLLADKCSDKQWHYESQLYFRGTLEMERKNIALRLLPNRRYFEHGGRQLLTEDCGIQQYDHPYTFNRHIDATYGPVPDVSMAGEEVLDFNCLTIYNEYMITDHLLSPLQRDNAKCYRYRVDSIRKPYIYYTFKARRRNTQLVSGHFVYDVSRQCLKSMDFSGEYGFLTFSMKIYMGSEGNERYWPKRTNLTFKYRYLGNVFKGDCLFTQKYNVIEERKSIKKKEKKHYDISDQYVVRIDTTSLKTDSSLIANNRTIPLNKKEISLYKYAHEQNIKSLKERIENDRRDSLDGKKLKPWYKVVGSVGEMLVNRHNFDTSENSYIRLSSPNISFSGWKGISYRQDIRYSMTTKSERTLVFEATGGYNFRPKQFVWQVGSNYLYSPILNGRLSFSIGSKGMIDSAQDIANFIVTEEHTSIEESDEPGSDEDVVFNHTEMRLENTIEPISGLRLLVGGVFNIRTPRTDSETIHKLGLKDSYRSFSPRINVEYTPCQYYYRQGNRRVAVGSDWPTICVDWERGIKGMLDSNSNYEKWEFTLAKDWTLDALHKIMAKVGGGLFTNKREVNFVDYRYFYNGIIDYNWNDDVSGVFQLLSNRYYNNAYRYLRGHIAYETPTLVLRNVSTRYLRSERFYLNTLLTQELTPYIEFGYGISSHIADLSGFTSLVKGKFDKAGVKFTLHLFD